jgi:thiamine biosynthesis lipoprotein ApbE
MLKIANIIGLCFFIIVVCITGCIQFDESEEKYEDTRDKMDTFVSIIVYSSDEAKAIEAIESAYKRIDEIVALANRFNESSEISQLNSNGILKNPSPELVDMIETSVKYNSITNGAFDITILPLLDLWSPSSSSSPYYLFNMSQSFIYNLDSENITDDIKLVFSGHDYTLNETPTVSYDNVSMQWTVKSGWLDFVVKNESDVLNVYTDFFWNVNYSKQEEYINTTKKYVGSEKITVSDAEIILENGMSLTLDGIAKGFAVDEALKILKEMGINSALINAGGDIATHGTKPDGENWVTGLRNPDDVDESIMEFGLSGEAIATSGNYERYFNESAKVGHIMDPTSGRSVTLCSSSTIIADNCTVADILATAVFVLGPVDGINLVDLLPGVETIVLGYDDPQNLFYSSNLTDFKIQV